MNTRVWVASSLAVMTVASLAFGVPALLHRAHAEEAILNLSKLMCAADVYFVKPRAGADGERMLCQFPQGEVRTSLAKSCCDPSVNDGEGRCDPAKIEWNRSLWKQMRFELDEPHWFIYEFKARGTMADAAVEVSAYGDADCDGHYSTFRFTHHGDPSAQPNNCVLATQPQFLAVDPEE